MSDNGFYLYTEYADKFKRLTDAQLGQLIRCLLEYKATGEEPEIDDMAVGLAFDVVKIDIDKQTERYQKKAEAGRKGGSSEKQTEAEESNTKQTEVTESKPKQSEANESNAKQTEADESKTKHRKEKEKENKKEKKNIYPPIVPPTDYAEMPLEQLLGGDVKLANAARDWIRYKQARGDPVNDSVFKSIMSEIGHRASIYGVDEACKTIAHSIASTYKGIAWDERKLNKAQAALNEVDTWV